MSVIKSGLTPAALMRFKNAAIILVGSPVTAKLKLRYFFSVAKSSYCFTQFGLPIKIITEPTKRRA